MINYIMSRLKIIKESNNIFDLFFDTDKQTFNYNVLIKKNKLESNYCLLYLFKPTNQWIIYYNGELEVVDGLEWNPDGLERYVGHSELAEPSSAIFIPNSKLAEIRIVNNLKLGVIGESITGIIKMSIPCVVKPKENK